MKTNPLPTKSEIIVQQQVEAYNKRCSDAFMSTFSENICVYQFPEKILIDGREAMRKHYETMFEATPDLHCEITNRIVLGSTVIDRELVLKNGEYIDAIAIYQVEDGYITRVTFVLE